MMLEQFNATILCVDDEEGILETYRNTLQVGQGKLEGLEDLVETRRNRRRGDRALREDAAADTPSRNYQILCAPSGEAAIEIVKDELAAGRQIAVGFFDMCMPGGMDGQETIAEILKLDSQMLCAVVTAYTDRSPEQLGKIFQRQDGWLYFNKPFSRGELQQTALHLVTSWNQKRREEALVSNLEMMQSGLLTILHSVTDINQVPPLVLDHLLDGIIRHFLKLLDGQDGFMLLRTPDQSLRHVGRGLFSDMRDADEAGHASQAGFARQCMAERRAIIHGNLAAAPLIMAGETVGALFVQKDKPVVQNPMLLEIFCAQAVHIFQNSQLYRDLEARNTELTKKSRELLEVITRLTNSEAMKKQFEEKSLHDHLTGLPNRRYLEERFLQELSRARRHAFSLACMFIDIDHFKRINDTHGHLAGDFILKELGALLTVQKRIYDIAARYGGEEFVLLFKQIQAGDALIVAERIRLSVEKHRFSFEGEDISVTVSMGVYVLVPESTLSMEVILRKADAALYQAKNEGRNRTVIHMG